MAMTIAQRELSVWQAISVFLSTDEHADYLKLIQVLEDYWEAVKPFDAPDPPAEVDPPPVVETPGTVRTAVPRDDINAIMDVHMSPGDTLILEDGTYQRRDDSQTRAMLYIGHDNVKVVARVAGRVTFDGGQRKNDIIVVTGDNVHIAGINGVDSRRSMIVGNGCSRLAVVNCHATGCRHDSRHVGAAFRLISARDGFFGACTAFDCVGGFQLRESDSTTGSDVVGGDDNPADRFGSCVNTVFQNCIAYGCRTRGQHSDGFGARYANETRFEGCVAINCADDGFDVLGCALSRFSGCVAAWNGGVGHDGEIGNGNGFKSGARGGYANNYFDCLAICNERGGFELGDCIFSNLQFVTAARNKTWFGIFSEATAADNVQLLSDVVSVAHSGKGADIGAIRGTNISMEGKVVIEQYGQWLSPGMPVSYNVEQVPSAAMPTWEVVRSMGAAAMVESFRPAFGRADAGFKALTV